jgi:hypothetical protein
LIVAAPAEDCGHEPLLRQWRDCPATKVSRQSPYMQITCFRAQECQAWEIFNIWHLWALI